MSSAGVCKALIFASVLGQTSCAVWDLSVLDITIRASQSSKDFDALVQPLAEMSKLAYTSTAGSYFKPGSLTETPVGWRRVLTWDPAVGYGMRAIVFVEDVEEVRAPPCRAGVCGNSLDYAPRPSLIEFLHVCSQSG